MKKSREVVTLMGTRPLWFALVSEASSWYGVGSMSRDCIVGFDVDLLDNGVVLLGLTKKEVLRAVKKAFPKYEKRRLVNARPKQRKVT